MISEIIATTRNRDAIAHTTVEDECGFPVIVPNLGVVSPPAVVQVPPGWERASEAELDAEFDRLDV